MNTFYIKSLLIALFLGVSFAAFSQIITTVAGNGVFGFTGDGGQATAAEISGPGGNALFDHSGNTYFDDQANARIRKINSAGIITTIAGNGIVGFGGDGGPATAAEFNQATVITFDSSKNMYVADYGNNRIRKINTAGIITTFAGNGIAGYSGNGGAATNAQLNGPCHVIADNLGNIFIADSWNNVIRKVNSSGIITLFAGNSTAGFSGDGGNAALAELDLPFRIMFDKLWNMYIADSFNSRIRKVNTLGIITTIAGNGTPSFAGDGGQATLAEINKPYGVCVDASGVVYIGDTYSNRIREVNSSGIITTIVGNGIGAYCCDGGPPVAAEVNFPTGVSLDYQGNLYIEDYANDRIRKIIFSFKKPIAKIKEQNDTICLGSCLCFTDQSLNSPTAWSWQFNGASPGTSVTQNPCNICYSAPGKYGVRLIASNVTGSDTTYDSILVVAPPTVYIITGKDTICAGENTNLSVSPGGLSYLWSTGATTSGISVSPASTTTYTVAVRKNGCAKDTSIKVTVNPLPNAKITGTNPICFGDSSLLSASGGDTYMWSTGATSSSIMVKPLTNTTYSIHVNNGVCSKDTSIKIIVSALTATISSSDTICQGDIATLSASGGGNYKWSTGSTLSNIGVAPTSTTIYSVTITNGACVKDTSVMITVKSVNGSLNGPFTICMGDSVNLNASGGGTYLWSTGSTTSSVIVHPKGDSIVNVTVSNNGCSKKLVTVIQISSPNLLACCDTVISKGDSVLISASGAKTYKWSPSGGLSCTTCPDPFANPTVTTVYTVTATDTAGCVFERVITVLVESICKDFIVPNVFTPNGDGINDVFIINPILISSYSITIYDRWGKIMYQSTNPSVYWNGNTLSGSEVPDGVYYYIIKANCHDNTYDKHGYVQVVR